MTPEISCSKFYFSGMFALPLLCPVTSLADSPVPGYQPGGLSPAPGRQMTATSLALYLRSSRQSVDLSHPRHKSRVPFSLGKALDLALSLEARVISKASEARISSCGPA